MNTVILTTTLTTGASDTVYLSHILATKQSGIVQVDGIDGDTVQIQGRLEGAMNWVTIATFTANDAQSIMLFPEMRVNLSVNGSGTIVARIGA
tara:strand:+ start:601 stop:879 length:279 start_codon:yes stop_codon:yes gene_type:complete